MSDYIRTSNPSFSLSCHSEKSRVNFSRAGNPRPLLPPHGHRSSLSLKRVVDQSLQIWSRFGGPCCPLTPIVGCHLYSAFKHKITDRIIVNLPMGASLKLKALMLLANVSNNIQMEYLMPKVVGLPRGYPMRLLLWNERIAFAEANSKVLCP